MAGPFARIVATAMISTVNVVARAFLGAYQQAVANAKHGGNVAAVARPVLRNQMSEVEALQILNIEQSAATPELVREKAEKYMAANEPDNGGSLYLKSKVGNALETMEELFAEAEKAAAMEGDGAAAGVDGPAGRAARGE